MTSVFFDISVSLDGYVAGPDPSVEEPLGAGGERLHDWALAASSWRAAHGREGGSDGIDDDVLRETIERARAVVMGRNMFSGGFTDGWEDDPRRDGWWGDDPPFHVPVFVVTHHPREPLTLSDTTFTFVTEGVERAIELARQAAGDGDVQVAGGGDVIRQALRAGAIDDFQIHVAPVLLGGGVRLFDAVGDLPVEPGRVLASPAATHLRYRVVSAG